MHGCSIGNASLVNAEVDSMGGVIDSGVGIGARSSPQRTAVEKAQAELRREYDVREERRRELEFLEKGGNPLDFKFGNAASVSVQSTSLTDQPPEQLVTSEAKGSFALAASPHGDSVESSGRPDAAVVSEPNCADNLLLFDGEHDSIDGGRNSVRFVRSKITPVEQTSQLDGTQNVKESGDSAIFGLPKGRAYKRRNRSRPNRDGARSSSTDIAPPRAGHISSLSSRHGLKDVKASSVGIDNQKDQNTSLNCNSKLTNSNGTVRPNDLPSDGVMDVVLDNGEAVESTSGPTEVSLSKLASDCRNNSLHKKTQQGVAQETSATAFGFPEFVDEKQMVASTSSNCPRPSVAAKPESVQQNGFYDAKDDKASVLNEGQNYSVPPTTNGLESESNCTETSCSLDQTTDCIPVNGLRNDDLNGNTGEQILVPSVFPNMESDEKREAKEESKADDRDSLAQDEPNGVCKSQQDGSTLGPEGGSVLQAEGKPSTSIEQIEVGASTTLEMERKPENALTDDLDSLKKEQSVGGLSDPSTHDKPSKMEIACSSSVPGPLSQTRLLVKVSSDANKQKASSETETDLKLEVKAREDSILKEARIIEAKRKRIAQLSVGAFSLENHQKSHWDFVLEEMAWLANDFAQERLWKVSAADHLCHQIASTSKVRLVEKNSLLKQKKVAHNLSKAIMEFWHSEEESRKELLQCPGRNSVGGVLDYAVRFLKDTTSPLPLCLAEAPVTPERIFDLGVQELSWEQNFTVEDLFYTVPAGAMETYRKAIESHLAQAEITGSSIQEEVETSICDAQAGNAFEEEEGETNTYLLPGDVESGKPSSFAQKKRHLIKSSSARSYDLGTDLPFMQRMENKFGTQESGLIVKRPASSLHMNSIPTKRVRTASRPRFTTPFSAGTSGGMQVPNRTDASSGDTNSCQDDQSTFHGGSQVPNSMEVESVADFGRQLPFDSTEVSKPKKKKKPKPPGSTYEQRWQQENNFQNELGGYSRKRFDKLPDSNGSNGLFGQHIMKKQKMIRQPLDNSLDHYSQLAGSVPSPVASQMSNMSNSNKLIKILGGRDRRKAKQLKMPAGQTGPGSPWSSFEEQALIVLVHDLGPNWELISDAINNILQYKCIFRKPKECSEHHKELITRTAGDGADSAEDSGSSQPYPSTLPGIPKGSARALFQRLQEPIEEDMIKFHFEKIILMSQKLHYLRMQNDNQDQKPIQPHSSHTLALSQVCQNNLNGGPVLTPLDLCDTTASSPDVLSGGNQSSGGLATSSQGNAASLPLNSGANSSLQGSSNMVLGNNFSSPSAPFNSSVRDGRYVPRSSSLSIDEQQRMQQYNQMMPGRVSGVSPGSDRGVRMLPGGNGMGVMSGMNRNMTMVRPGFQGIPPSPVLNSSSMLSSSMSIAGPANMHPGIGAGPGSLMMRPRDSLNMMRPSQIPEHQRQMLVSDLRMQGTQANSQGGPSFGGLNSSFSTQTSPPPSQAHPFHHQQQHQSSPQQSHVLSNPHHSHLQGPNHVSSPQQAYAIRIAKEKQLQHRMLQQQHAMMPRGPPQAQAPILSSLQSSSNAQPQTSAAPLTPSSSMSPMSQHPQKLHMPPHGLVRNPQSGANQTGKQRQRQSQQQLPNSHPHGRQHPQQRQQQQVKIAKGAGRGNLTMHQNLSIDPSILNGLSPTSSQSTDKIEQPMHMMHGQSVYPGSGLNSHQLPNKPLVQQKLYSGQATVSSTQAQQLPSHSESSIQGHATPSTSNNSLPASQQAVPPLVISSSGPQQRPTTQKLVNQNQLPVLRVLQQNRQMKSDSPLTKFQADQGQRDQQHLGSSSSTSQMGTTAASPKPAIDQVGVQPVISSSSSSLCKASGEIHSSTLPKPATQSASVGNPLTSIVRTQSMPLQSLGSREEPSVNLPTQGPDIGPQKQLQQSQIQASSPSPQEQQPLSAQQLQAGNGDLHSRSTDNIME